MSPRGVVVVGAGMAGLATAWLLQEAGVEVTVVDRRGVAAGASWGNAGWLAPALTVPLPEPAALKLGLRRLLSPASPLYIPPRPDPRLARFLLAFVRNCTAQRWTVSMAALATLNRGALAAYDDLARGGIAEPTRTGEACLIAFADEAGRAPLVAELEAVRVAGQEVDYDLLDGAGAHELEPSLSARVGAAVRLHGQRHLNPGSVCRGAGRRGPRAGRKDRHRSGGRPDTGPGLRGRRARLRRYGGAGRRRGARLRSLARPSGRALRCAHARAVRPRLQLHRVSGGVAHPAHVLRRAACGLHAARGPGAGGGDDGVHGAGPSRGSSPYRRRRQRGPEHAPFGRPRPPHRRVGRGAPESAALHPLR